MQTAGPMTIQPPECFPFCLVWTPLPVVRRTLLSKLAVLLARSLLQIAGIAPIVLQLIMCVSSTTSEEF